MKGFKSIPVKFKCEPITIKEPYKPELKTFDSTDEFTAYFRANEDAFKEVAKSEDDTPKFLSANKLNRTYKIPGYRIRIINKGKDNEELTLIKDYYNKTPAAEEDSLTDDKNSSAITELTERIDDLTTQLTDIIERVNNIEEFLMQLKRR